MIPDMANGDLAWLVVIALAGLMLIFAALFLTGWAILRVLARVERWARGRRIHRAQLELAVTRRQTAGRVRRAEREIAQRDIERRQNERTRS